MRGRIWSGRWSGSGRTWRPARGWWSRSPPLASGWTARRDLDSYAGRAGHAGSTEAAVSAWVLRQVLLVVVLRVVEGDLRGDLGRDRAVTGLAQRGLERLARLLRGLALRRRRGEERTAVRRSDVVPLAHALGRVMALPERAQQLGVGDPLRVVHHQHRLGVPGRSRADLAVGRILGVAATVHNRGGIHAVQLPELPLGAPEATHPEEGALVTLGEGRDQRGAQDDVPRRHPHRLEAAWERFFRGWHVQRAHGRIVRGGRVRRNPVPGID